MPSIHISDEALDKIRAWLSANGIDPGDVPFDGGLRTVLQADNSRVIRYWTIQGEQREHPLVAEMPIPPHVVDETDWKGIATQREDERDGAYRERAHLVALLAAMTDGAVITYATDVEEPGWQIVYLTFGGRQASWHISPRDAELFAHVERVEHDDPRATWDGHTTEEKYEGIAAWTAYLTRKCGPACSEMHTETGRCEIARNR